MELMEPQNEQIPILWRWLDRPGLDTARLAATRTGWDLSGSAVFLHESSPCRLDYQITLDPGWQTRAALISGWVGTQAILMDVRVDRTPEGGPLWWLNYQPVPEVAGCVDIDLNFSPATNLLPIRRLGLQVGQSAELSAAWLRFPGFTLEPLSQVYRRTGPAAYQYESASGSAAGSFTAGLTVNSLGFVTDYPPFWQEVHQGS